MAVTINSKVTGQGEGVQFNSSGQPFVLNEAGEAVELGPDVLRITALHKPYGTSDASFNKTSALSALEITTLVKTAVNAPYNGIRLVSTNRGTGTPTGLKAIVSATETMSGANSAVLGGAVIGGSSYQVLAPATSNLGQRSVTWGGAATINHSASTASGPDLKLSDWVPLKSVPRADGGTGYIYMRKMYRNGALGTWAFTGLIATPAPSAANRNREVVAGNYYGDAVATIGSPFSLTNVADDVAAEIRFDRPVLSVWGAGDSIMSCVGLVADKASSWLARACEDVTASTGVPVVHANFGAAGMASADFLTNVAAYLAAGVTPPSVLVVSVSINELGSTPDVRKAEVCINSINTAASLCEKYRIPHLVLVPVMPNENIGTDVLDAIRKQINTEVAAMADRIGASVINISALGDGAARENWIPAYRFDAIHPNEAAIDAVMVPAIAQVLASIV